MSETFRCEEYNCDGMTVLSCIRRQIAKEANGSRAFRYPFCAGECARGKEIKSAHPELESHAKEPGHKIHPLSIMKTPKKEYATFYKKEPGLKTDIITPTKRRKEEMVYKEKPCEQCSNMFMPTGPRSKRCDSCKGAKKSRKKATKRSPKKKLTTQRPDWYKKEKLSKGADTHGQGELTITVDLSFYPEVHKRLLALAREEFRTPEMQLAKMVDEELRRREVAA